MTGFPIKRLRRLRKNENLRRLVRETRLSLDQLVMPYFLMEGNGIKTEIKTMPGQFRFSVDEFLKELEELESLSIHNILLFGIPSRRDTQASQAYDANGVIQRAVREIKKQFQNLLVITDVCLCEYMSHGHCGVVKGNEVLNDETLLLLQKTALSHVEAGSDMVAPSDMMDGRIGAIRKILDEKGFKELPIMSYAAKYASTFYGPFREAAESAPEFGDRKSYQMNPANVEEALREMELDIEEGADIVMVKPALAFLDVISRARQKFNIPIAAYNVSGEYAMVKAAAQAGYLDEEKTVLEIVTSIARAGAGIIFTYHAKDIAYWFKEERPLTQASLFSP